MNYLQLCQRLRAECQDIGSGPQTVSNASGRDLRYVNAIREAWQKIQLMRSDWDWLLADDPSPMQTLSNDGDEPFIEPEYHAAIVWYALTSEGLTLAAAELLMRAQQEWNFYYGLLVSKHVAKLSFGGGEEW